MSYPDSLKEREAMFGRRVEDSWVGCYDEPWKGDLIEAAFQHPAKISRGLARRIYAHAVERGWLKAGDCVLDPFAGIGGTALDAMAYGLKWTGVELEPHFVEMCKANLALWETKYGRLPGWGSARIIQGDSRKLSELVGGADAVVGSPPFLDSLESKDREFQATARPGRTVQYAHYGASPGQLGAMKEGKFDALISSPPYGDGDSAGPERLERRTDKSAEWCKANQHWRADGGGQQSEGSLMRMPMDGFSAVVSSPPYEGIRQDGGRIAKEGTGGFGAYTDEPADAWHTQRDQNNLGNLKTGNTFWSAARIILSECRKVLKPGGIAIWVCKDFIKKGKRVPFSDQWQALCESCGFTLLERHRAMLVEALGTQNTIFGELEELKRERKSFFRRLAEKKGSPAIDWEDVLVLSS